jgi:hypothetical protein
LYENGLQSNPVSDKRSASCPEPDEKQQIERRMDELAREYGLTPRGDPRREEIANELSALCWRLDHLLN